ncbi:MAG: adenylate kinase [Candidatus Omnitrophota bacterium]
MKIILFGAPGSGKGTQAQELSQHYSIKRISLGDIFRQEVKKGSDLGKKVKNYMDRGVLVPDDIVTRVVEENLKIKDFILDGYPRNLTQALHLDEIFARLDHSREFAIYLEIDATTVIKRLELRRVCQKCGKNYHAVSLPSAKGDLCEVCDGKLIQRDDDKPEVIRERLEVFFRENKPLLDFYEKQGRLSKIDASGSKDAVCREVTRLIDHGLSAQPQ